MNAHVNALAAYSVWFILYITFSKLEGTRMNQAIFYRGYRKPPQYPSPRNHLHLVQDVV